MALPGKIKESSTRLRAFYNRNQKYAPLVSFFAGFTWDSLTLTRIDLFLTNLVLFLYIFFSGLLIVLINMQQQQRWNGSFLNRFSEYYPLALQFFLGGLYSSYVVFYFQSASLDRNWLFLIMLLGLLVGNEFLKDRLQNTRLQMVLYFLALYSFFVFFVPVIFKSISVFVFLFSGFLSCLIMAGILYFLSRKLPRPELLKLRKTGYLLAGVVVIYNFFYFSNLMPPVPLSLKEGGFYHSVQRVDDSYTLRFEKGAWYEWFRNDDSPFAWQQGDTVFCFSAVFAPTALETKIWHHWQVWNESQDIWQTTDRHSFAIVGGRDGGYRGYSYKKNIQPGEWRVNVETDNGQLLGRVTTEVIPQPTASNRKQRFKTIEFK